MKFFEFSIINIIIRKFSNIDLGTSTQKDSNISMEHLGENFDYDIHKTSRVTNAGFNDLQLALSMINVSETKSNPDENGNVENIREGLRRLNSGDVDPLQTQVSGSGLSNFYADELKTITVIPRNSSGNNIGAG